ncbi:MAG: (2Fe-2S)-binding protein [Bdellovibrionales bacterium]|nr:(2Fe-2S)-binding protein [Bdellovibrionales bacterium]
MTYKSEISGQDWVELTLDGDHPSWRGNGCISVLNAVKMARSKLNGAPKDWTLPEGQDHGSLLLREVIMKARGEWKFPYDESELCHCRMVPTAVVDRCIQQGVQNVADVSRKTNAGTGCGTCRPNIQEIIDFRYKKSC